MTAASIWDEYRKAGEGRYVSLREIGDGIAGTIVSVGVKEWPDGKKNPELTLITEDGLEKVLTVSHIDLARKLAPYYPDAGDKIDVKIIGLKERAKGNAIKIYDVKVQKGGQATEEPGEGAKEGAEKAEVNPSLPQQLTKVMGSLNDEQRAALEKLF